MLDKLMKLKQMRDEAGGAPSSMRPVEQNAKMSVLKDLIGEAGSQMGDSVRGLKKVSVMAPSSQGLEDGLDKARQMVGKMPDNGEADDVDGMDDDMDSEGDSNSDMDATADMAPGMDSDAPSMEATPEEMQMSADELDQKIQSLMKLKEDKMSSSHEEM